MEMSGNVFWLDMEREGIEHLKLVDLWFLLSGCLYLFVLNSAQSSGKKQLETC